MQFAMGLSFALVATLCASAADQPKSAKSAVVEPPKGPVAPPKGLVLYYSFDNTNTSGTVTDVSGHNRDGKATGAHWVSFGKQGGAYEFSSYNNFIQVTNSASLNLKQATFAVWFKTSRTESVWRRIIDKRMGHGFALSIAGDSRQPLSRGKLTMVVNGRYRTASNVVVADGAWHHGAATVDGTELKLYVDGILQKQITPCTEAIAENSDPLTIGMNRTNPDPQEKNQSFEGLLDELMVFNRALGEDEIKAMVIAVDPNAGKPKFTKQQVAGRLRQLKLLWEEGLLTDDFYDIKCEECESAR